MRELRLTAVSEDGAYLILSDGDEQFALRADERLHAAIRGDRARLGQLEIQLESQLRPRDIQARIRAGESVESVAAAATMPLEKVRRFASPVIAEREHIAGRAQQATVRRISGEGPVRTLETAAADYAASIGAQPDAVTWDAWRADDGRWRIRCAWPDTDSASDGDDSSEASAIFSFDPTGRSVTAQDATARLVAGEPRLEPESVDEPAVQEVTPGPPRLSVVSEQTTAIQEDEAVRLDEEALPEPDERSQLSDDDQPTTPIDPVARRNRRSGRYGRPERRRREPELWGEQPTADQFAADEATTDRLSLSDIATHVEEEDVQPDEADRSLAPTAQDPPPVSTPPTPPRGSSKSRRPSVPSWDEIMFGRRKND